MLIPLNFVSYHDAVQKAMLVERKDSDGGTEFHLPRDRGRRSGPQRPSRGPGRSDRA